MCIILARVESVSNTQLYISSSKTKERQLVIYTNKVTSPDSNAMILPVPNPLSVELLNFRHYKDIFEDCQKCFRHYDDTRHLYATRSLACSASDSHRPVLPVYTIGSYQASIVPSLDDFDRLNTNILRVNPEVASLLRKTYDSEFGFLVCQLKRGNHQYHPFAYTHSIHSNRLLFVPTLHYHLGEKGSSADWDHTIYSPMTDLFTNYGYSYVNSSSVQWDLLPSEYQWARKGGVSFNRHVIKGYSKNKDLWLKNLVQEDLPPIQKIIQRTVSSPEEKYPVKEDDFLKHTSFARNLRGAFR